jgi:hypothetical protein
VLILGFDSATVSAIASVLAALTAIVGIPLILRQLNEARAAAQLAATAARSQAYGTVADGMDRLNQFLAIHPDMLSYLYGGKQPPPATVGAKLLGWIELMCEEFMDFMDSVNEQRRSIPAGLDWSTWDAYFRYCYQNSPVLRHYVADNLAFYPDYALAPLGYIVVRRPQDGRVLGTWIARDARSPTIAQGQEQHYSSQLLRPFQVKSADLPQPGYPWVTTWAFSPYRGPDENVEPEILMSVAVPHERRAEVAVRSVNRVDEDAAATLRSWIVDGMRSVGLDFVDFHEADQLQRYDMRKLGLAGERAFEVPRLRSTN